LLKIFYPVGPFGDQVNRVEKQVTLPPGCVAVDLCVAGRFRRGEPGDVVGPGVGIWVFRY
jgi:hypothetical protein